MERLIDAEDAVLSIAKFLSAKDCLSLHAVSRKIHGILGKHDEALFENHLRRDFSEGRVLLYVAEKKNLSRKKLYRAFLARWSLPKQADEKIRAASEDYEGDRHTKILIDWVHPPDIPVDQYQGAKLLIPNDDVDSVVFIARVGSGKDDFCALMEWNPEHSDHYPHNWKRRSQLIIDKSFGNSSRDENGVERFHIPQDREANDRWCNQDLNVGQLTEVMKNKHLLTLHVVDTRNCQVASLMDNSPLEHFSYNNDDESDFTSYYGAGLPSLWGVTPEFSPFHRKLTEKDFLHFLSPTGEYKDPPLGYLPIRGEMKFDCGKIHWMKEGKEVDVTNDLVLSHPQRGVNFTFRGGENVSSVRRPHQICNFLRALMNEKCTDVEPREITKVVVVTQQPKWVQADKVLDTITSYASFEDQAGKLRLVCRQFDASALRQIEAKLDKVKVIAFRRGALGECWFKATVRRGWSDTCLASKESAINDALWLASCRCYCAYCANEVVYSPGAKDSETKTIDEAYVRQKMADRGIGELRLSEMECSIQEEEMTLFQLCRIAGNVIPSELHRHLKRDYGVSTDISTRQLVRSIFLVFARAESKKAHDKDESAMKKARISRKVTIEKAKSHIHVKDCTYYRSKRTIRFHLADNEPMEICFDSRGTEPVLADLWWGRTLR